MIKNLNQGRKPQWLRKKISFTAQKNMDQLLKDVGIHTICQEAKCPNISECFESKQATFLILGNICTRACTYCNVTTGSPASVDQTEIKKTTQAIIKLDLQYVVITSPARDDLEDGGAKQFYDVTKDILKNSSKTTVELLIPDFKNDLLSIEKVAFSGAKVIGHNIETVPRFYNIRKSASYERSLKVLDNLYKINPNVKTKSALMVGFGETEAEMIKVFKDLLNVNCKLLSIGQYLAPSSEFEKVVEFVKPSVFNRYKQIALDLGFEFVHSSPYTRSSYMAHEYTQGKTNV